VINIYIIKLTDDKIYLYHQKTKNLVTENITKNIIKNNKVYHVKKTIKTLRAIIRKHKINNHILRKNHIFLIDKSFSPVEIFALEYCLKSLESIKYTLIKEETLVNDKNALIIWQNTLNVVEKGIIININKVHNINLKANSYVLYGISEKLEDHKKRLSETLKINILEYENSETILFEGAK